MLALRLIVACVLATAIPTQSAKASEETNPLDADRGTANAESGVLQEDMKAKIDATLGNSMGGFSAERCDAMLGWADHEALIPYLIEVMHSEDRDWHARQRAAFALGRSGDPRGVDAILKLIHEYLQARSEPLSKSDSEVLCACIYNLGRYGTKEAEDEAFEMLKNDYWTGKPVPVLKPKDGSWTAEGFRRIALVAISYSGADRAVRAFGTGEEIPEDLWAKYKGEMAGFAESARKAREKRRQP